MGIEVLAMQNDVFKYSDYKSFLRDVLDDRRSVNRRYSMRAFARDLDISAPNLCEILGAKKGMSVETAYRSGLRLGLSGEECEHFCDLVQVKHSRSEPVRAMANARIGRRRNANGPYHAIDFEMFRAISDWYHFAIIELTQVEEFRNSPKWIAERLGVSEVEVEQAIERLCRLGLLTAEGGTLLQSSENVTTTQDVPSSAIRKLNRQLLHKAISALDEQAVSERDCSTLTVAIDRSKIPEVKKRLIEFRRDLNRYLSDGPKNDLYCLTLNFFRLTQDHKETNS